MRSGILLLLAFTLCRSASAGEAAQTDWSGGGGQPGPVIGWTDVFAMSTGVHWAWNLGELRLIPNAEGHVVDPLFTSASAVQVEDVDGDGDLDILGAGYYEDQIAWWDFNTVPESTWTRHVIAVLNGAIALDAGDVDGDGDLDVAAASPVEDLIMLYRNGGSGGSWTSVQVDWIDDEEATSVDFSDIDGDGDMDLLGAWEFDDALYWYENVDGSGQTFTRHTVEPDFNAPYCILAEDMDQDGDPDVLATSYYGTYPDFLDHYAWWSNDDGVGGSWTKHVIDGDPALDGAASLFPGDMDGDGDLDIVGHTNWEMGNHDVLWFENADGTGSVWQAHLIDSTFCGADGDRSILSFDLDGDGDLDVLAGSHLQDQKLSWWSNMDGAGGVWHRHTIENGFGAHGIDVADLDGDGLPEVVAGSWSSGFPYDGSVVWWDLLHATEGELVGSILDSGTEAAWGTLSWEAATGPGTQAGLAVRASSDPGQMGNWIDVASSGDDLSGYIGDGLRYVQYRVTLSTTDPEISPVFQSVSLAWEPSTSVGGGVSAPGEMTVAPQPAGSRVELRLETVDPGPATLEVYDLAGRFVDRVEYGELAPGPHLLEWFPEATSGGCPGKGLILLRLVTPDGTFTHALLLLP